MIVGGSAGGSAIIIGWFRKSNVFLDVLFIKKRISLSVQLWSIAHCFELAR